MTLETSAQTSTLKGSLLTSTEKRDVVVPAVVVPAAVPVAVPVVVIEVVKANSINRGKYFRCRLSNDRVLDVYVPGLSWDDVRKELIGKSYKEVVASYKLAANIVTKW